MRKKKRPIEQTGDPKVSFREMIPKLSILGIMVYEADEDHHMDIVRYDPQTGREIDRHPKAAFVWSRGLTILYARIRLANIAVSALQQEHPSFFDTEEQGAKLISGHIPFVSEGVNVFSYSYSMEPGHSSMLGVDRNIMPSPEKEFMSGVLGFMQDYWTVRDWVHVYTNTPFSEQL